MTALVKHTPPPAAPVTYDIVGLTTRELGWLFNGLMELSFNTPGDVPEHVREEAKILWDRLCDDFNGRTTAAEWTRCAK